MKFFTQIAEGLDMGPLRSQLAAAPHLWDANTLRKTAPGTPHGRMSDIWVRYNDVAPFQAGGDYSRFNDPHIPIWYPAWGVLPALRPIVFGLMAAVEGTMLGGVLITRIPAGEGIAPHVDRGWHVDYFDKFYVAVESAPGAEFHTTGESLTPLPGSVWRFDNRNPHWVTNDSGQDRVTLIVCVHTDKFKGYP